MLQPCPDPAQDRAERARRAQESLEQLFGEAIGGELFALVTKHLSAAQLTGYAHSGVQALADAAGQLVKPGPEGGGGLSAADAEAINQMMSALSADIAKSADAWLDSEKGQQLAASISQWLQENPGWTTGIVITSAISAAVIAYLQNADIPVLERTFRLGGGFTGSGSVDLGSLQEISIRAAKAALAYQSENFAGSVSVNHDGETGVNTVAAQVSASGALGKSVSVEGKGDALVSDDGTMRLSASGALNTNAGGQPLRAEAGISQDQQDGAVTRERVTARVRHGNESEYRVYSGHYDRLDESFQLQTEQVFNGGDTTLTEKVTGDGAGGVTSSRDLSHLIAPGQTLSLEEEASALGTGERVSYRAEDLGGPLSLGFSAGTGTLAGFNGNMAYQKGDLEAALDLEIQDQVSRLTLSASSKPDYGWSYGGDAIVNLSESRLEELGAHLGWKHPKEFKSFALNYRAKWLDQNPEMQHHFDSTFEYAVGRVSARLSGSMDLQGRSLTGTRADLLMGYELNPTWTALGGVSYAGQRNSETHNLDGSLTYKTGVQYKKDVAFTVGYTPDREEWSLGVVIPLGR